MKVRSFDYTRIIKRNVTEGLAIGQLVNSTKKWLRKVFPVTGGRRPARTKVHHTSRQVVISKNIKSTYLLQKYIRF